MKGTFRLAQPTVMSCEVLIIGSGAGAGAVADCLTRAGWDVLMLEEGPMSGPDLVPGSVPESLMKLWRGGGITATVGSSPISYAEGRCVGGSTEINSAIMQRTPGILLDEWAAEYSIDSFGETVLAPYFDRVYETLNASLTQGPLGEASEILKNGARAMGWKISTLERAQRRCVGTNLCSTGCPTGGKQSMSVTLLPAALARGMRLVAECYVKNLTRRGRRVTGAIAEAQDSMGRTIKIRIQANHVFVCAGAIHTPALLRRSSITKNIGNTLRLHPTIKVIGRFDHTVNAHESRLPLYAVSEFMPDLRLGGSMFNPGFFGMSLAEDWSQRAALLPEFNRCGMYYAMARGQGTGYIRPIPGTREPFVSYSLTKEDWQNLKMGVVRLAEIMFAAGAELIFPSIADHPGWTTAKQAKSEFEAVSLSREKTSLMTIHLLGSCPPGENADLCATDSFGRVRGFENLIVADASQIPKAPGVNPQATVMALAYRAAEAFLNRSSMATRREACRN